MATPPAKKVCLPENAPKGMSPIAPKMELSKLALLTPNCPRSATIKARVCSLEEPRQVSGRNGMTTVRNCNLRDMTGTEMNATFWGDAGDVLQTGKVYEFSKFTVRFNQQPRSGSKLRYCVVFDPAEVKEAPAAPGSNHCCQLLADDGAISTQSEKHWTTMKTVKDARQFTQVDMPLVVVAAGEEQQRDTKLGSSAMRELQVVDETGTGTRLTLWGEHATQAQLEKGMVVAASKLSVRDFNGAKSLTLSKEGELTVLADAQGNVFDRALEANAALTGRLQALLALARDEESLRDAVDLNQQGGGSRADSLFVTAPKVSVPELVDRQRSFAGQTPETLLVEDVKLVQFRSHRKAAEPGVEAEYRPSTYLGCNAQVERQMATGRKWTAACNKKVEGGQCPDHGLGARATFKLNAFVQFRSVDGTGWTTLDDRSGPRWVPQLDVQELGKLETQIAHTSDVDIKQQYVARATTMLTTAALGPAMDCVFTLKERAAGRMQMTQTASMMADCRPRLSQRVNFLERGMANFASIREMLAAA